ncbi:MAG: ABC transporter permease [Vicinamibacterales bacterium]
MRLRQILRRLLQLPTFTIVTIATLAIGVGANTAMFSVVQGILLTPLPYPNAHELIAVDHAAPGVNIEHAGLFGFLYFTYREQARTIGDIGIWRRGTRTVTGVATPEEVSVLQVSDRVLPMLGAQALIGRLFSAQDDDPRSPRTVILSAGYWKTTFGANPSVLGQRLLVDGELVDIIGVLPESFRFLDLRPALVLPMRIDRSRTLLGGSSYAGMARLRPGVTVERANAEFARLIPVALQRFPPFPGVTVKMFEEARITATSRGLKEHLIGDVGTVLWVLMATIGVVLLIACANVANLLLVRAEGRQQELAIRAALGASWSRVARELLAESVVLGLLGGVLGVVLAYGALRVLLALAPGNLPRLQEISIDATVLLFTLAISIAAGLLFGAIPVVKYAGPRVATALRAGGRGASRERSRARSALAVVQVALALVLLVSSSLMIRTFQALRDVNPGFTRPEEVLTLRISIPQSQVRDPIAVVRMQEAIAERVGAIAGVKPVGLMSSLPMDGNDWSDPLFAEDHAYGESQVPPARSFRFITPGLLAALGRPLVIGRDFTWTDTYEKRPLAMVSERLARELWRTPSAALGKRIRPVKGPWREVVAVVSDSRDLGVNQEPPTMVYWPILMDDVMGDGPFVPRSVSYVIRSSRVGSETFFNAVSQAVWSVNPNLALASVQTLQEIYNRSMARTSFTLVMLALAGAMALLLGIAGIYGVISYSVSQRTREIGIRLALGAKHREVTRMFVAHGVRLAVVGIVCGLAAAFAATRLMVSLLFNVSPVDPVTYAGVAVSLLAATMVASYLPALRATSIDPVEALRSE